MCKARTFFAKGALERHISGVHHNERFHICEFCMKDFSSKASLLNHMVFHDSKVHEVKDKLNKIKCELCDKVFHEMKDLKIHVYGVHKKMKKYQCNYCEVSFTERNYLAKHIKTIHAQIKDYRCDACEKSYSDKNSLTFHIQAIHEGEKHNCDSCESSYTFKSNLQKHIRVVHEKRFVKSDYIRKNPVSKACK